MYQESLLIALSAAAVTNRLAGGRWWLLWLGLACLTRYEAWLLAIFFSIWSAMERDWRSSCGAWLAPAAWLAWNAHISPLGAESINPDVSLARIAERVEIVRDLVVKHAGVGMLLLGFGGIAVAGRSGVWLATIGAAHLVFLAWADPYSSPDHPRQIHIPLVFFALLGGAAASRLAVRWANAGKMLAVGVSVACLAACIPAWQELIRYYPGSSEALAAAVGGALRDEVRAGASVFGLVRGNSGISPCRIGRVYRRAHKMLSRRCRQVETPFARSALRSMLAQRKPLDAATGGRRRNDRVQLLRLVNTAAPSIEGGNGEHYTGDVSLVLYGPFPGKAAMSNDLATHDTTNVVEPSGDRLATFDPKVKVYLWLQVAFILCATMIGILGIPLWLVLGPFWANLYFPTIEARLTERSLVYRHGVWFRQEMSIPLDKIQDVSLHTGPILDALGLTTLRFETAGGGQAGSSATLTGVMNAEAFRAAVIARRDALSAGHKPAIDDLSLLREIRDSLLRIEGSLKF